METKELKALMKELSNVSLTVDEKLSKLSAQADGRSNELYNRPLSEEEKVVLKDELCNNLVELDEHKREFTLLQDEYRAKIAPLKSRNKELLEQIKTGGVMESGTVYYLVNREKSVVYMYHADSADFVGERVLTDEERQGKLFKD